MHIKTLPELTLLYEPHGDLADAYAQIHALGGPGIFRSPDGGLIATSYGAIQMLRKSPHLESLKRNLRTGGSGDVGALAQVSAYTPFFVSNPLHTPLSLATYKPFSPTRRGAIAERFTACVHDALAVIRPKNSCDLVKEFARTVTRNYWMGEIGAPASMQATFSAWFKAIEPMLAFRSSSEQVAAANQAAREMLDYMRELAKTAGEASLLNRYTSYLQQMPDGHQNGADLVAAITFDGIDSAAGAITNFLYVILSNDELQATLRKKLT